ncbi:hypothetical protein CJU89_6223 [Yarrowia sp. B02]|nr:hypothetical protein CJU89_6223 [Yarrowia sp. B02]
MAMQNFTTLPNSNFIGQTNLTEASPASGTSVPPSTHSLSDLYREHKFERQKEKIYSQALRKIEIQEWIDDWADLIIDGVESVFVFDSGPNRNGCNVRFSPKIEVIPQRTWYTLAVRRLQSDLRYLHREVLKVEGIKKKKVRFAKDTYFY